LIATARISPKIATAWKLAAAIFLALAIAFAASDTVRFTMLSAVALFVYGTPDEKDVLDANAVRTAVITTHSFKKESVSEPGEAPVFFRTGSKRVLTNPTVLKVYDVIDKSDQDEIIGAVRDVIVQRNSKPVDLRFYENENWNVTDNLALRGPEKLLRRTVLSAR
jgi:hypothetical protein